MKKISSILLILLFGTSYIHALTSVRYFAIIDAGSSGSRLNLYKYQKQDNNFKIKAIKVKNKKIEPGISSIAYSPNKVGKYIQPLIKSLKNTLPSLNIDEKDIHFYVLSTAGMRVVSPILQKKVYNKLTKYIAEKTKFKIGKIATIPGKHEGIFDWISYNYLTGKLFTDKTMGILDMGGGSFEICFATDNPILNPMDKVNFKIGAKRFNIYSHSYLGLGQELAMSQYTNEPTCFPKGYPMPDNCLGTGDFNTSLLKIDKLVNVVHNLNNLNKPSTIIPSISNFIGMSGLYFTPNSGPFGLGESISIKAIKNKGIELGQKPWRDSEKKFGSDPYLYMYYFSSAFISVLLENGFGFNENSQFNVIKKVNGTDLSWTLGALIYYAEDNAKAKKDKEKKSITKRPTA